MFRRSFLVSRTPMIQFRFGANKSNLAKPTTTTTAAAAAVASSPAGTNNSNVDMPMVMVVDSVHELPPKFQPKFLADEEIDAIMSGGCPYVVPAKGGKGGSSSKAGNKGKK
eukprot:PhM_4_TR4667/c0_g1_i1/m.35304